MLSRHNVSRLAFAILITAVFAVGPAEAQTQRNVLFIRGAERSGGFLEADNDTERTEQLADINNTSTSGGNHGWNELRLTLEANNFSVSQIVEPLEVGAPSTGQTTGTGIAFDQMDLSAFDVLVFASNNGVYSSVAVDSIEAYIRGGGGTIFISDANFGSDWADASNSDQQFLDRFGLIMHQDRGTYSLERSTGDFIVPNDPIFDGVDRFDGEGVTPIEIGTLAQGVNATVLAGAEGSTRLNLPPFGNRNQGPSRAAISADAALLYATVDAGRIIGHFDRNTFFNLNGAGTNINRFDNRQYAINLFSAAAGSVLKGDVDLNGAVDFGDIPPFIVVLQAGTYQAEADCDCDGFVTFADIPAFIEILMNF